VLLSVLEAICIFVSKPCDMRNVDDLFNLITFYIQFFFLCVQLQYYVWMFVLFVLLLENHIYIVAIMEQVNCEGQNCDIRIKPQLYVLHTQEDNAQDKEFV
jgi:hypothetical protein